MRWRLTWIAQASRTKSESENDLPSTLVRGTGNHGVGGTRTGTQPCAAGERGTKQHKGLAAQVAILVARWYLGVESSPSMYRDTLR